jgi:hypothetical protein
MVSLKRVVLFLIVLCLYSCGGVTPTKEGGLRISDWNWRFKKDLSKRINPKTIGIDTNAIYKRKPNEYYKNVTYSTVSKDYNIYYRFLKNGYVYYFYAKNIKLTDTLFKPKKGNIGFIIKEREENFYLVGYSPTDGGTLYKSKIKVKGDTIIKFNQNYSDSRSINYIVKIEAPKEWLNWKPDF